MDWPTYALPDGIFPQGFFFCVFCGVALDTCKQCLWLSICHKLLVEGNAPKPPLNTEFHSVAACSANAFLSVPGTAFQGIEVRESLTPFANMICSKIEFSLEDGVAKHHPIRNTFQ